MHSLKPPEGSTEKGVEADGREREGLRDAGRDGRGDAGRAGRGARRGRDEAHAGQRPRGGRSGSSGRRGRARRARAEGRGRARTRPAAGRKALREGESKKSKGKSGEGCNPSSLLPFYFRLPFSPPWLCRARR